MLGSVERRVREAYGLGSVVETAQTRNSIDTFSDGNERCGLVVNIQVCISGKFFAGSNLGSSLHIRTLTVVALDTECVPTWDDSLIVDFL